MSQRFPVWSLILVLLAPAPALAQSAAPTMSFSQYLARVLRRNRDLEAARIDVDAAEARVQIAAQLPDPRIWGGLGGYDVSHATRTQRRSATDPLCPSCLLQLPTTTVVQLDVPVELGDQQGRRMDLARVGTRRADAVVEDTERRVRGQAAHAWIDALTALLARERLRRTLANLEQLVRTNEARVRSGAIGEIELVQSRVEAQMFHAQVLTAEGQARAAVIGLFAVLGRGDMVEPDFQPEGDLALEPRHFDLRDLIAQAIERRPDLHDTRLAIDAGRAEQALADAREWGEVTFSLNWVYSAPGLDTQFNQTAYNTLGFFVGFPIPFHLMWSGRSAEAAAHREAAEARYDQAVNRVEVELRQALARYEAAAQARALFARSVIADAERVLAATRFEYERGGASLVEVLVAQRTANAVYNEYYTVLSTHAHALVDVETAAGIWDVVFAP